MRKLNWNLIASFILHASLIALIYFIPLKLKTGSKDKAGHAGNDVPQIQQKLLPPEAAVEITVVDGIGVKAKPKHAVKKAPKCKYWYGGVGLTHTPLGIVLEVTPGYPAYAAGIKVGDELVEGKNADLRGDPGTTVSVLMIRDGHIIGFTMVRDKVCYDGT